MCVRWWVVDYASIEKNYSTIHLGDKNTITYKHIKDSEQLFEYNKGHILGQCMQWWYLSHKRRIQEY